MAHLDSGGKSRPGGGCAVRAARPGAGAGPAAVARAGVPAAEQVVHVAALQEEKPCKKKCRSKSLFSHFPTLK